jgi:putative transposase
MPPIKPENYKTRRAFNIPGEAHELTFTCYHRLPLLVKDRTRKWFLEALTWVRQRYSVELWAYVIMPEHAHVLLFPTKPNYEMEDILKSLKLSVSKKALAWLRKHDPGWLVNLKGEVADGRVRYHFWQTGGGYDRNIVSRSAVWASIDYLHNNPLRRGLAKVTLDWRWSSARWYAGFDNVDLEMDLGN